MRTLRGPTTSARTMRANALHLQRLSARCGYLPHLQETSLFSSISSPFTNTFLRSFCSTSPPEKPTTSTTGSAEEKHDGGVAHEAASSGEKTHFGFEEIPKGEKEERVGGVFASVAQKYDIMNDFMSGSLHRVWKEHFVKMLTPLTSDDYQAKHIDVAGGTGDIAFRIVEKSNAGYPKENLAVTIYDINDKMLEVGKERAVKRKLWSEAEGDSGQLQWVQGNAETLPFPDATFDSYTIAFGIRNCTNIPSVLSEAFRVLKPGGRFLCLEFSHVANPLIREIYDKYSFNVIPVLGQVSALRWLSFVTGEDGWLF